MPQVSAQDRIGPEADMAQALRGIQTKAGPGVHWGVEIEDTGAHIQ